jgi:hypothetical protein
MVSTKIQLVLVTDNSAGDDKTAVAASLEGQT